MADIKREPLTRRQATRGKVVHLHKYWKGVALGIADKESRRQFLNLMIDGTMSEQEWKLKKRKDNTTKEIADE